MQVELNYKDYSANFENNILNIYTNQHRLLTSKAYSDIVYIDELKDMFENIINRNIQ